MKFNGLKKYNKQQSIGYINHYGKICTIVLENVGNLSGTCRELVGNQIV